MIPNLLTRSWLIMLTASIMVIAGAFVQAPVIVVLGSAVFVALVALYIAFFPVAVYLRRRKIDLAWFPSEHRLTAGQATQLQMTIRNHGLRSLHLSSGKPALSAGIALGEIPSAPIPSGHQVVLGIDMSALAFGKWSMHGCELRFRDPFELFEISAYFPSYLELEVGTGRSQRAIRSLPQSSATTELGNQVLATRKQGNDGELQDLRDYAPGDAFKHVSWKASARRQKLIVRSFEHPQRRSYALLVDAGFSMTDGAPGEQPLDAVAATLMRFAKDATQDGHLISMITFDTQVLSALEPAAGSKQLRSIQRELEQIRYAYDANTTDVSGPELVTLVSRYFAQQEGQSFRVPPPPSLDAARWTELHIGDDGHFYDLRKLLAAAEAAMARATREPAKDNSANIASRANLQVAQIGGAMNELPDAVLAVLRKFCASRSILLRRSQVGPFASRSLGLVAALQAAAATKPSHVIVVSTGHRLREANDVVTRAVRDLKSKGIAVAGLSRTPTFEARLDAEDDVGIALQTALAPRAKIADEKAQKTWEAINARRV